MKKKPAEVLEKVAREWFAARNVIADALMDWGESKDVAEHQAAAIIARLASHDPPILLSFAEEE